MSATLTLTAPVFVYGTLRVGHGNFSWAVDAVKYVVEDCTTEGRIYFVSSAQGYPVAKFDEVGTIIGDVLWFDPTHPEFRSVVQMEVGAGYELRNITAYSPDRDEIKCQGFHYIRTPRGQRISSGNWVSAVYD